MLNEHMAEYGERVEDILSAQVEIRERWPAKGPRVPDHMWLDMKFNPDFGCENGPMFRAWTANRVYFPVRYDGSEWVGSVPRNPAPVEDLEGFGGG